MDWIVKAHPYLASFIFLAVWCSIGYLEGRFISPVFACVTWSVAILASVIALIEMPGMGSLGWILAIPILLGGIGLIVRYYSRHSSQP